MRTTIFSIKTPFSWSVLYLPVTIFMFSGSIAVAQIPTSVTRVTGKEYSENRDQDQLAVNDDLQNLHWTGFGTTFDAFDYTGSGTPAPADPDNVDALANGQDYLFYSVQGNQVPFLVSFSGSSDVYYHNQAGTTGVWATRPQVRNNPPRLSDDLDAMELWGDENTPQDGTALMWTHDANFFSIKGDPIPVPPAWSVYRYDPNTHTSFGVIQHDWIRDAVATLRNVPNDFQIDVDALMMFGNDIMFSLEPNSAIGLDGGELFTWTVGALSAQYLVHGGRVWDTNNPVATLFGVNTENIDAFEAVTVIPEPSGMAWLLAGAAMLTLRRRRRSIRKCRSTTSRQKIPRDHPVRTH